MAVLTVTPISRSGIAGTLVAAAVAGDSFPNTGKEYLEVVNGGGAPITVTIDVSATVDGLAVTDRAVIVTNAQRRLIGPFPIGTYNDGNSRVVVTYSAVTSVTVGAFSVTPE